MKISIAIKEGGTVPAIYMTVYGQESESAVIKYARLAQLDYLISSLIAARVRVFGDDLQFQASHPADDGVEL
jgi:hypothetical protein